MRACWELTKEGTSLLPASNPLRSGTQLVPLEAEREKIETGGCGGQGYADLLMRSLAISIVNKVGREGRLTEICHPAPLCAHGIRPLKPMVSGFCEEHGR